MIYSNLLQTLKSQTWTQAQEDLLLEPFTYLTSTPGKEIRSRLISAFNNWLNVEEGDLEVVRKVVGMLHVGSLLMDDVEDDSQLRRGIPVAHKIYGVPQTINTANYVYFLAYQELFQFRRRACEGKIMGRDEVPGSSVKITSPERDRMQQQGGSRGGNKGGEEKGEGGGHGGDGTGDDLSGASPEERESGPAASSIVRPSQKQGEVFMDEIITVELLNLHRGQGLDLFWRDTLTCPTEEEYVQMVLGKTGGLFRIAVKLMMARSVSSIDYVPLVNLISILFQIRDDYMNLQSSGTYADNKGFAEDLTEGKFSFLVVHAVRAEEGNREILNILQKRTESLALKSHAVNIMANRTKSFEYTRGVLQELETQVLEEIGRLGGNEELVTIVNALSLAEGDGL